MTRAEADCAPPFWTEPWRWAAPAWHRRYGAPVRDLDCHEARLVYSAWADAFGLTQQWRAPRDPRWLSVVRASPAALRGVAATLGYIALLRERASSAIVRGEPIDRWFEFALKYREVNCLGVTGIATRGDLSEAEARGVRVLRCMAQRDWPQVSARIAMLTAPEPSHGRGDAGGSSRAPGFVLERIDVGRCLTISAAVARQASNASMERGDK